MNELEIKEKSATIYELSREINIQNQTDLTNAVKILKGVKNHREKVIDYWKTTKESARNAYKEIVSKEKEMPDVCNKTLENIKSEILNYKSIKEQNVGKLSAEAEKYRKQEVEKLLDESIKAQENGNEEAAKSKFRQAEMIENLDKYTVKIFQKSDGITTQNRWQCRITDNKSVPAFFNGIEIREISTKKLLEIRKSNPSIKIPGVEFYKSENLIVGSV